MPLGTVNIEAKVTQPDGSEYKLFGLLRDMESGDTRFLRLVHGMVQEGIYIIDMKMTPPSDPFTDHIFDSTTITYEVEKYGFEKLVDVIGSDEGTIVTYQIENPTTVQYFESIHAVINLPEVHTFEKITVTNGDFVKDYNINTQDIYLESKSGYSDLRISLVKENFIIPTVDAQNTLQEYVTFYKINKDMCSSLSCVTIDSVKPTEEFPLWVLGFLVIGIIIPLLARKKKQFGNVFVERSPSPNAI